MKRIAWLLLALSLPAWATINGVDSSRILIPCVYGQRDSEYPAGGACNPPAPSDYIQSFASFSASSSAYAAIDGNPNIAIHDKAKTVAQDADAFQISDTQCRDGDDRSMLLRNDGEIKDVEGKHRLEIYPADNLSGYDSTTNDIEYWFGWSVKFPIANWPKGSEAGGGSSQIISGQWGAGQGPSIVLQFQHDGDSDGKVRFNFRRGYGAVESGHAWKDYYYKKGATGDGTSESGITNSTTNSNDDFPLDQWVDIIVNFQQDPDGATGFLNVWVVENGHKTLMIAETGVQIGYADEAGQGLRTKSGLYFGTLDRAFVYQGYFDAYSFYQGDDGYDAVAPSGTPCS
jgi:hypothetical protein